MDSDDRLARFVYDRTRDRRVLPNPDSDVGARTVTLQADPLAVSFGTTLIERGGKISGFYGRKSILAGGEAAEYEPAVTRGENRSSRIPLCDWSTSVTNTAPTGFPVLASTT